MNITEEVYTKLCDAFGQAADTIEYAFFDLFCEIASQVEDIEED